MSVTPGPEAVDKDINTANIVDNVNDKTPDPEAPKELDNVPEPPRPDREGMDGGSDVLKRLGALEELVEKAVSAMVHQADEAASGTMEKEDLPWTHRMGRRKS